MKIRPLNSKINSPSLSLLSFSERRKRRLYSRNNPKICLSDKPLTRQGVITSGKSTRSTRITSIADSSIADSKYKWNNMFKLNQTIDKVKKEEYQKYMKELNLEHLDKISSQINDNKTFNVDEQIIESVKSYSSNSDEKNSKKKSFSYTAVSPDPQTST